jgi:hypothetical protein
MITQQQINNINKLSQDDKALILQNIAKEFLCPIPIKRWLKISGFTKSQRTAYNLYRMGVLKGIKLGNVLLYTNWQYDEEIKKKYFNINPLKFTKLTKKVKINSITKYKPKIVID